MTEYTLETQLNRLFLQPLINLWTKPPLSPGSFRTFGLKQLFLTFEGNASPLLCTLIFEIPHRCTTMAQRVTQSRCGPFDPPKKKRFFHQEYSSFPSQNHMWYNLTVQRKSQMFSLVSLFLDCQKNLNLTCMEIHF